jgi:hypothetical protein
VVGDTEGHNMSVIESKGTNTSTSDNGFMEGAETVNCAFGDVVMGTGQQQGYVTFKSGDDITVAKWKGEVKTTMTEEGAPNVTFSGTFKYVMGAGQYENITGNGTYNGQFTSKSEYTVEWEGEYSLK